MTPSSRSPFRTRLASRVRPEVFTRRQSDCVRVVPLGCPGDVGRRARWERPSAGHDTRRCRSCGWWMVAGRHKDRVRSGNRRQHRRLSRRSRWRAPAPADHRTLHRRSSLVVGRRAVDLFRVDSRRGCSGHLAGPGPRRRSRPTDTQRRLRAAGVSGRPVPLLSRPSSGEPRQSTGLPG